MKRWLSTKCLLLLLAAACPHRSLATDSLPLEQRWHYLVAGMEASRRELVSGEFNAIGQFMGFVETSEVDGAVEWHGRFDCQKGFYRLDRDDPTWQPRQAKKFDLRTFSAHIFTPDVSVFYADPDVGGGQTCSIASPDTRRHQDHRGNFYVRALGLYRAYSQLRFGGDFDKRIAFYRAYPPPTSLAEEEGLAVARTSYPYAPPQHSAATEEEFWICERQGFTPVRVRREVSIGSGKERKRDLSFSTDLTWEEKAGVWVPVTYRMSQQRFNFETGEVRTSVTLDLALHWVSVNEPIPAEVFDYRQLKVQEDTLVVDERVSPSRVIDTLYAGGPLQAAVEEGAVPTRSVALKLNVVLVTVLAALWLWVRYRKLRGPGSDAEAQSRRGG